jgi:hypothetical protein
MSWFNLRRGASAPVGQDRIAKGIAVFILKMQRSFARYMNKVTAKMSSATMKVSLIVFLSFGTSLSFYFIVAAIVKEPPGKKFKIQRISVPRNLYKGGGFQHGLVITKEEYEEMRRYTDSLQRNDSLMSARPGLMDSIKELESIYEQDKK